MFGIIRKIFATKLAKGKTFTIRVVDSNDPSARPELVDITVATLDEAKARATWLTKGFNHDQPTTAVLLKDCTVDHLKAILANKPNLSSDYRTVIEALAADKAVPYMQVVGCPGYIPSR